MTLRKFDIAAIIPALNEAATIATVVKSVAIYATPIVIDDGSTDATAAIARSQGAVVISHEQNQGYEFALSTGFKTAINLDFRYVITLDADGQHNPEIISLFYSKLKAGADVVVGIRNHMQRAGENVFSTVANYLWGLRDPLCGMKAYTVESLLTFDTSQNFDSIGTKYAIDAVRRGNKLEQVNIIIKPRFDAPRFGIGWVANKKIFLALYKTLKVSFINNFK